MRLVTTCSLFLGIALAAACGGNDGVKPIQVHGSVFDIDTGNPIEGARVMAMDTNRSPVSGVATTDADGNYSLELPTTVGPDGNRANFEITLRAEAAGYVTFPGGVRQPLPVNTNQAMSTKDGDVLQTELTDVGLLAMAGAPAGSISGTVDAPDSGRGVLIVAEGNAGAYSTLADLDGNYQLLNVADGSYEVAAYTRGQNYTRVNVDVAGNDVTADLAANSDPTSSLAGKVSIVNPGAGTGTSVVLVVASTFDDVLVRGATPPGLRAPDEGTAPTLTGDFSLDGIPDGDYMILAAFEDDNLVRDPDTCIAGTTVLRQGFSSGDDVTLSDTFKITGSLDIISPGADGPEAVGPTPTLTWVDDSSEDSYHLQVFDSLGQEIWSYDEPGHSGDNPSVTYAGPALTAGEYYQFRVTSIKTNGGNGSCEISQTEDLKGVFYVQGQ